jgi:hypothetical protein
VPQAKARDARRDPPRNDCHLGSCRRRQHEQQREADEERA